VGSFWVGIAHTALIDSDQLGPGATDPDATPQSRPEIKMSPSSKPRRRQRRQLDPAPGAAGARKSGAE